jgi:hypothetical protein
MFSGFATQQIISRKSSMNDSDDAHAAVEEHLSRATTASPITNENETNSTQLLLLQQPVQRVQPLDLELVCRLTFFSA